MFIYGAKMLVDGRYVIFWTRRNPPSMTQIFKFHKLNTINNFYFFIILYDSISYASQMDIYQEIKKKYGLLLHYTPIFQFFRNEWTFLKKCVILSNVIVSEQINLHKVQINFLYSPKGIIYL